MVNSRKPSERLIRRLVEDGALTAEQAEGASVLRTYAGYWQRIEGAWSWYLVGKDGRELFIGSQWPITDLLRSQLWSYGNDGSVYP